MSQSPENTTPVSAKPSRLAMLRGLPTAIIARIKQRPRLSIVVGGVGVMLVIGFATTFALLRPAKKVDQPELTMRDALEELQAGNLVEARSIANQLRAENKLSFDERGGPAYIHGAAMAREAMVNTHPEEQLKQYLIAARYLDSAYRQNYPATKSVEGLMLLGQCWHDAGRYARALPVLTEALKRRPRQSSQLHRLLASCYYRDVNPQYKLALENMRQYLANKLLSPVDREAGLLESARIHLEAGQVPEARELLTQVPENSTLAVAANVLKARLAMQRAQQATGEEATAAWNEAIALLRVPAGRDPMSLQAQREAQYLLGLCYLGIDDERAAENQFLRSRRINQGLPEGLASAMEEADLKRQQGQDAAALDDYRQLLRSIGDLRDYSNPWLPLDALRERLLVAYRYYRDANKFDVALTFVQSLTPILTETRTLELKAEVERRWGDQLLAKGQQLGETDGAATITEAHAKYHLAAGHLYRLARLSLATKEYPDRLWDSAECYGLAHDFHRAVRVLHTFLEQYPTQRRADALLAIAQAELALGNLEAAITSLELLLRDEAKHPLSYRARLLASEIYREQTKYPEAQSMLRENLDHEALTPKSIEWRDSLFALGMMLFREGLELEAKSRTTGVDSDNVELRKAGLKDLETAATKLHEAILRLSEALQRYPDAPLAVEARYAMAESHRQAAKWPRKKLPTVTIETARNALHRQLNDELMIAHKLYGELIEQLNTQADQKPLAERERDILRNCYFFSADTLFDAGKYDEAIAAYSSATNRYQDRPEALEAFVQIASCYRNLDQPAKARGTLEQAKVILQRIPADAQFDETTRYSRSEWTTLLDFMSTL